MILSSLGIIATSRGVSDADAQAFITAASITDNTQKNAINQLVIDLKNTNIWTKMKAIYPFVGGTAAQHRFNLKDPRAVNAAFYLDFIGGGTHNADGYLPNGTTAYADTKLAPSAMGQNSVHISVYSRTNVDSLSADIYGEDGTSALGMLIKYGGVSRMYLNTILSDSISNINPSTGLFVASRTSSATSALFQNGTKIKIGTRTSLTPSTFNVYLGAGNYSGTPSLFSIRQQAFSSIGDGLTDSEATALYNAVQTYQTALGRQV